MKMESRRTLLRTTALMALMVIPTHAFAGPENGSVTSGSANIQVNGNQTTINQSTDRAIIRWDSFDLNAAESVQFNQPGAGSITVNRIQDTKASRIDGHIGANGNIILINPNGVVFGATSTVDVGSLIATSSDIEDDAAFMAGGAVKFTRPGAADARIVNEGTMTAREGGLIGLVAPHVENSGVIEARLGKAVLASGDIATIDFAGDGLIKLEVTVPVLSQSVKNSGVIRADGGSILITAAQARTMVDALIVNTGTLQARTVTVAGQEKKGSVTLSTKALAITAPRGNGEIYNTGMIDVSGDDVGESGGDITIVADRVSIGDGSYVTAAADTNGGSIRIGGEYQGGSGLPTSDMIFISEHVILNAGSRRQGQGGTVILWSDTITRYYGHTDVSGGIDGGDGGFIEVSSKGVLDYTGSVHMKSYGGKDGSLLLDPTDIVISAGTNTNVSGSTPFTPTVDDGPSILNISTLLAALSSGNVTVQTRSTGSQTGNITIDTAITWAGSNVLTLDAHNNIIVNNTVSGDNLTLIVGNDLQLNAALTGAGTLTIQQAADGGTIGIGASAVGTLNLSTTDLANITDGWDEIVIGKSTSTAVMDVRTVTFTDDLTLKSGTGVITINGTLNTGANTLTLLTDGDISLIGALTGTGTLNVMQNSVGTTIGLNAAGTINLTTAEVGRITNGWSSLVFGRQDGTGALTASTMTWNDNLILQTGTGVLTISGTQTMGANTLTLITDSNLALNGNLSGSTTVTIQQTSAATTMSVGTGQTGTLNIDDTERGRISNGWASIVLGRTDGTGDMNIGASTWSDHLTLQTGTGIININGAQAFTANNLTIVTDADVTISSTLTSTGTLTIRGQDAATSIGLGTGQTGTIGLSDAEIANIVNGWSSLVFGRSDSTGTLNVGALTWNDNITLQTGTGQLSVNGTQTMGANNVTLRTDSNLAIGGALTSTGTLIIIQSSIGTSMGFGTGQSGTLYLDATELGFITNGWTDLFFGRVDGTGSIEIGAVTWQDRTTFRSASGQMSVNGNQSAGGNTITFQTDSDLSLNANVAGTGSIVFAVSTASSSIGVGTGQTGMMVLDDAELGRVLNGWANIFIGTNTQTGAINVGARSWVDPVNLRTLTGQISINGAQALGGNALNINTDTDIILNAGITGTGNVAFWGTSAGTTMGIGDGQAGTLSFSNADLAYLNNGFGGIYFGSTSTTGTLNVGAYTWNDNLFLRSNTGLININGVTNTQGNNLTFQTSNLTIGAALTGTGTLSFTGTGNGTTIGIGTGQAGSLNLTNAELAFITDGWTSIIVGSTAMTGAMNIGALTWQDSVDFRTNSGAMNINGAQNVAGSLILRTNTNLAIGYNLSGTGNINILGSNNATTVGVGTGQTGTLQLTDTELSYIADGWSTVIFGGTAMTGALNIGARTWTDSVEFRTNTGIITIGGAQNVGANNLVVRSNANPVINAALTGTGTITFLTTATTTTLGVGTGQTGTYHLDNTELGRITNGWSNIVFGNNGSTVALNVGAYTWNDNVTYQTATGVITIAGAQNVGSNNLTIRSSGNTAISAALTGTGTLTLAQQANNVTLGIGTGQTGTLSFTDAELANITNGWGSIVFGRTDSTAAVNIGAYNWSDNVTFQSGSGIITVVGAQAMGANNLTISTNANLALNANLSGTGTLTIRTSNTSTTIGIGTGQAGTLSLIDTELARFVNGWNEIIIGSTNNNAAVNVGAYTWLDKIQILSQGNIVLNGAQGTTETSGTTLVFATTNGAFINNAGASAINPGTGRYLVYSVDENNDTLGGIIRPGIITNKSYASYGPSSVVEAGSQHIYSGVVAKILYLTIDDKDKVYGDNLPVFTYTYVSGLVNGDLIGDAITSFTLSSPTSSIFDDAGTTRAIVGSFTMANGYSVVVTDGTLTVTKATITVESDAVSREYGDANPTLTATYTGFKNGDDITDINTQATVVTTANALSNVGTYAITASGASDNNYDFVYVSDNLTVTKATLTATMQNASREYGAANPTFTATYTGFKNGETAAVIDTLASGNTAATLTSNTGVYTITGSGAFDNNYTFSYVSGNLTVTKATLTATADNKSRDYGDTNPALSVTYTGFRNGDTASVIDTLATPTTSATTTSNVGTYTINAAGAFDNNYTFNYVSGTLTVNKATLTATAGNVSREYGDANPAIGVTYTGFKNGETSAVIDTLATASSAANATSNVGTYSTVASGGLDNNYQFNYVDGTLTVTKATLTATAGNVSREYGDANPAIGVTYSGFKNGETSAVIDTLATASSAANATSNVGSYSTVASGALDNNYNFTYVNGTLTVNKATLTATAGNVSREYGDANPAIGVVYTGFKNGETSAVIDTLATASSAANATSNVGTYSTVASGGLDNNYQFNYVNGTLTVNKATLTATAGNVSREYGDANPAIGVVYTGFKNGETLAVIDTLATASSAANTTSNVGTYSTVASGGLDNNYQFNYVDGTLTVTKATLTATAGNVSREYGDANPAIGVVYTGFKNGETSAVIDTLATASSAANATSNVGTYSTVASGGLDNNYQFNYVNGTLTVTKATLTATAANVSREYGEINPAVGVIYTGFKNGETSAVIDTLATTSSAANTTSNVGTYSTVAFGASDGNYNFNYVDGTLTVTKATLTATAGNVSREYGDANPAIGVTYSGFKNGETSAVIDTLATASSAANATSNVGTYSTVASGALDNNYNFTYVNGTLTVNKATLTATAGNASREYGDANPAIGVTYTGFKNGETSAVIDTLATASSAANATSNVGTYSTVASGGLDNNYQFNYVNGTLTVNKATLTATAGNVSREYGDANPAIGVVYTGFKNGETSAVIDTLATASSAANATSNVGTYSTVASGGLDNNYQFNYVNGTLTVTKATLTATAGNVSREYGDANPAIGVTYTGFKNGETSAVIDTLSTASSAANAASNVGTYSTVGSGGLDNNYQFNYVNGTLTVNKATLTATANNTSRAYGDANPSFTATYTGFKNGESAAVIDTLAAGSSTANVTSNTGTYGITLSGAVDNNYNFVYAGGILTVTKATLTATADNKSRDYGQANPTFTVTYSGFRNGESAAVLDTPVSLATAAGALSSPGVYAITVTGGLDNNYTFVYVNGSLTVIDAALPPPPPAAPVLPSTVEKSLTTPPVVYTPTAPAATFSAIMPSASASASMIVIEDDEDYEYAWEKDKFLIALTGTVQNYYQLIRSEF